MRKISPFLWFDTQAEEAATFYTSLFPNSEIVSTSRYPEGSPAPAGSVMSVQFRLADEEFTALNAGPLFKFNESISFFVNCDSQEEVDTYWNAILANGGTESQCGWIKDKFGLSWQIVPALLGKLMGDSDKEKAGRVMQAMLKMKKIDCTLLQEAANKK